VQHFSTQKAFADPGSSFIPFFFNFYVILFFTNDRIIIGIFIFASTNRYGM